MNDPDSWLRASLAENQRRQAQAGELQHAIATARGTARSPDGSVTAVVAPGGALVSLHLEERSVQLGARRLQAVITETIHRANADVAAKLEAAVRPVIGDRYGEALAAVGSPIPNPPGAAATPPAPPPPPPPPPGPPSAQPSGHPAAAPAPEPSPRAPQPARPAPRDDYDDEDMSQHTLLS
ncbi:YbaB/EbfC family nucleoid-associated protein [Goodfellowiella coeruleoviolacea]|uniref:YbaB/EbfC DNA-binding family protein n=1 Tax=Goodfellowiella coeruleoviolacea TaxID=334858 RepID=A0AAE3GK49_9PSEU|nr:YbaB/EbfC family nucleoid-associated protein [Goodfellowiella coeruleoviolacea]MCP2169726.1 YbaB/EbfC DNA-binding family protein [Goodfellowiella coeruleoviolacea]